MVKRRPCAFLVADALVGLFIVATLAAALAVALGKQRKSVTHLGNTREAVYLAERAMLELQCGREPPSDTDDAQIAVHPLQSPSPDGAKWVEVVATVRGRTVSLVGIVPRKEPGP